jgi:hypothetical protein
VDVAHPRDVAPRLVVRGRRHGTARQGQRSTRVAAESAAGTREDLLYTPPGASGCAKTYICKARLSQVHRNRSI